MTCIGITGHRGLRRGVVAAVDHALRKALRSYDPQRLVGLSATAETVVQALPAPPSA